jgi:uncharacterized protein (TIGR03437 family)
MTLQSSIPSLASSQVVFVTATVTTSDGSTPSGTVVFTAVGAQLGTANLVGAAGYATATISLTGAQLPQGTGTISATWSGGQTASLAVSLVARATSAAAPSIAAVANAASFTQKFAPGELVSVFGADLSPLTQTAASLPLPLAISGVAVTVNGVAAPVWYVSPNQLNIQIPYEIAASSSATLVVNNNGQVASTPLTIDSAAPGLFTDSQNSLVPAATAARGQTITLYLTGAGAVTPQIISGAAPSASVGLLQLPTPQQTTTVTVGGIAAPASFIGIPAGMAGIVQINFQIPTTVGTGSQAVIVTVGDVASKAANLIVTP